jgi:hypothetical protein
MYTIKNEKRSFETELLLSRITSELSKTLQSTKVTPTDEHFTHKDFIIQKLNTFMANDQEKRRDKEGQVLYKRVEILSHR